MTVIDDRLLRIVFDIAVNSMDFGSGFLDDEEVTVLREVAGILGVDPDVATPRTFKCRYSGSHDATPYMATRFRWDTSQCLPPHRRVPGNCQG